MVELKGRNGTASIEHSEAVGRTVLELALAHGLAWGFSCKRGTCARCRCFVQDGADLLEPVTDEEWIRLEPEELEQGYRLGCQAVVKRTGLLTVVHKPYF